ncbi:MAG: phosphate ABC transporter substrate-binding protein [Streptococcaceae bacterium]|nr:phosphate ABC transporter substrate-binding protein [Streptococcaceae bacterium]
MKKRLILSLVAVFLLIVLAACSKPSSSNNSSNSSNDDLSGKVIAGGSTALQPLAQQAATEFMVKHPKVQLTVQGGGSGVGLTQVAAATFQVGNSDIFAEEKPGIDSSALKDYKVAVVGIAPIVNAESSVSELTQDQLVDIFTGKITNWKEVGGKDLKITVISRTEGSGTRVNFDKFALKNQAEITGPSQDASGAVVTMVGQTPGAVSYVAFSYLQTSKDIKAVQIDGVEASAANVASNKWKIWAYEHMYTNSKKETAVDKAFIDYVKSDKKNLEKMGYIAISDMKVDRDASGLVSNK